MRVIRKRVIFTHHLYAAVDAKESGNFVLQMASKWGTNRRLDESLAERCVWFCLSLSGCWSKLQFTVRPSFWEPDRPGQIFIGDAAHANRPDAIGLSGLSFRKSGAASASVLFLPSPPRLFRFIFKIGFLFLFLFLLNKKRGLVVLYQLLFETAGGHLYLRCWIIEHLSAILNSSNFTNCCQHQQICIHSSRQNDLHGSRVRGHYPLHGQTDSLQHW